MSAQTDDPNAVAVEPSLRGHVPAAGPHVVQDGECPISSRKVGASRNRAEPAARPIALDAFAGNARRAWGIDRETAARRSHTGRGDEALAGLEAFVALWSELFRSRWLAALPGTGTPAGAAHARAVAPLLHAFDRSRRRRGDAG
jgi:hypothetical protein